MNGRREHGQAAVELVAFLPLVLLIGLALFSFLAAHAAGEEAGAAAEAGVLALLQGRDPEAAARAALPAGTRDRARIEIHGTTVRVRVRPRLPITALADPLTSEQEATAR